MGTYRYFFPCTWLNNLHICMLHCHTHPTTISILRPQRLANEAELHIYLKCLKLYGDLPMSMETNLTLSWGKECAYIVLRDPIFLSWLPLWQFLKFLSEAFRIQLIQYLHFIRCFFRFYLFCTLSFLQWRSLGRRAITAGFLYRCILRWWNSLLLVGLLQQFDSILACAHVVHIDWELEGRSGNSGRGLEPTASDAECLI